MLGGGVDCLVPAAAAAALAYKAGVGVVCGRLDLLLLFLPFPFHVTSVKSSSVGHEVCYAWTLRWYVKAKLTCIEVRSNSRL